MTGLHSTPCDLGFKKINKIQKKFQDGKWPEGELKCNYEECYLSVLYYM